MMQAQECLCPLNNLRLIGIGPNQVEQCPRNQLATPQVCHQCLAERGHHAGALHQHERALAGVGTAEYDRILRQSFYEAEAVLVLNPITAAMLEPYARRVCIVPWGIDRRGFRGRRMTGMDGALAKPMPLGKKSPRLLTLFMAAVAGEVIKGFHVAHEACRLLRETRIDFELVVTFDPAGPIDEFTRSVGWCSQAELPRHYRAADICLVPTIAQDALSITSVEAMAAGKPVIASRIGGLPYTVNDGVTGLLFEPGNPVDLAEKIARLLDDPALRRQMGLAGPQAVRRGLHVGERHQAILAAAAASACPRVSWTEWPLAESKRFVRRWSQRLADKSADRGKAPRQIERCDCLRFKVFVDPFLARSIPIYEPNSLDPIVTRIRFPSASVCDHLRTNIFCLRLMLVSNSRRPSSLRLKSSAEEAPMAIQRVAFIFDSVLRPETAGVYCHRALERLVEVEHFQPATWTVCPDRASTST